MNESGQASVATPDLPNNGHWPVDPETYHADRTAVSSSSLKEFMHDRELYHARYVAGTEPFPAPSDALKFGSAVHCWLLEREAFEERYAVSPETFDGEKLDRRKTAHKAFWAEFEEASEGKTIISEADHKIILRMEAQVRENPAVFKHWCDDALFEFPVRFIYRGIQCKCMFDIANPVERYGVNVKTTRHVSRDARRRDILNLGYHVSAALYAEGYKIAFGEPLSEYRFIWLYSSPAYSTSVDRVGRDTLTLGKRKLDEAIDALRACVDLDEWRNPDFNQIGTIDVPDWQLIQEGLA